MLLHCKHKAMQNWKRNYDWAEYVFTVKAKKPTHIQLSDHQLEVRNVSPGSSFRWTNTKKIWAVINQQLRARRDTLVRAKHILKECKDSQKCNGCFESTWGVVSSDLRKKYFPHVYSGWSLVLSCKVVRLDLKMKHHHVRLRLPGEPVRCSLQTLLLLPA